jgi:hypothetical protein
MKVRRWLLTLSLGLTMTGALALPDLAMPAYAQHATEHSATQPHHPPVQPDVHPDHPKHHKCNSGRGNGSEGAPDCDPGNSSAKNQGGD